MSLVIKSIYGSLSNSIANIIQVWYPLSMTFVIWVFKSQRISNLVYTIAILSMRKSASILICRFSLSSSELVISLTKVLHIMLTSKLINYNGYAIKIARILS
jgi:hypothetical protein